jgi:hypothetical protein
MKKHWIMWKWGHFGAFFNKKRAGDARASRKMITFAKDSTLECRSKDKIVITIVIKTNGNLYNYIERAHFLWEGTHGLSGGIGGARIQGYTKG